MKKESPFIIQQPKEANQQIDKSNLDEELSDENSSIKVQTESTQVAQSNYQSDMVDLLGLSMDVLSPTIH